MRRLTSVVATAAIALTSVAASALPAAAGTPGSVVETANTAAVPSSLSNMRIVRITRLSRTGEFLVLGRANSALSAYKLWQLKPDYTVDTTFGTNGVVDTGVSESNCAMQGMPAQSNCSTVRNLVYNEVSGTYALFINNSVAGSVMTHNLGYTVIGDLKTGAVKSTVVYRDTNSSFNSSFESDFASLNITAQTMAKSECAAANGASYNGANLWSSSLNTYSSYMVPSGSLVISVSCSYSTGYDTNGASVPSASNIKEYQTSHLTAFKVVNGALTVDTTWGTSGRIFINKVDSGKCVDNVGLNTTTDLGITSMSSTKTYTLIPVSIRDRRNTVPSGSAYSSYEGCSTMGLGPSGVQYTNKVWSITANGVVSEAMDMGTSTMPSYPTRWVIDPAGRWVSLVRAVGAPGASSAYTAVRLVNGKADASFGTNGQKTLSLPSTVTVNGTSLNVNFSISGMITTADEVLFTGLSSTLSQSSFMCNGNTTVTTTLRPFVLSLKNGNIDTAYGTNGLGDGAAYQMLESDMCGGSWGAATFVTAKGQPARLQSRPAIGSQTFGVFLYTWDTVTSATGGGDGGTGTGGATKDTGGAAFTGEKAFTAAAAAGGAAGVSGRVDAKVYTTAPAKVQENSAVSVLKPSEADDLDLVSTTPKVCIALTTSVVFTGTGRCVVRVIDEETRKVIRNFSTTVTKAEVTPGTVLTTSDPIMFRFLGTSLTAKATAQVKVLAESATTVGRVLVVGHSASLYDNEVSNKRIALQRAAAVKAALIKAGVKAPISIVSVGSADPVATAKTEASQAKNRRVEVFLFPASES